MKARSVIRWVALALAAAALVGAAVLLAREYIRRLPPPEPSALSSSEPESSPSSESPLPAPSQSPEPESQPLHTPLYPVGEYGPDEEREAYVSGEMTLEIPRLELSLPVYSDPDLSVVDDGVSQDTLGKGVGLFVQAQLPGPENRNVSIAGHRDVGGMEFYYLDRLGAGDKIYLIYQGKRYVYEYQETKIVTPDDWSLVAVQDFSCVTLQTCDPIGVASHRMFVVGKLVEIQELADSSEASQ
ncbi:MAG: sortase [Oscillospiraceae bacterium]